MVQHAPRIVVRGVGVHYLFDRQQRTVSPTIRRVRRISGETWALRDVSFSIGEGEAVGLLGASGSGKSTLLRLLASVLVPDAGTVERRGQLGSLLSVHAGVMALLTGRENTAFLGVLAGMTPDRARDESDAVREVSGLGPAYERLVASYSQGMRARLGLSIIERTQPDILLLDEIHEAFDHEFRSHVVALAQLILARGGVVVAAGHDHHMLGRLCNRGLWLRNGVLEAEGQFDAVRDQYLGSVPH